MATTTEAISGVRAASLSQSGLLQIAMAAVSGRMPAIGIVASNYASGAIAAYYAAGLLQLASGMADFSGYVGGQVWVGRSGQIAPISGSWSSGGFASGDFGQIVGVVKNSGAFLFNVVPAVSSGNGLAAAGGSLTSGQVTSGYLGDASVVSGSVGSGQIASGHIASGFVAALGSVSLTSGQITSGFLGNNSVVSGSVASGQIARFHVASGQFAGFELGSGAVVSGRIASGQVGFGHLANAGVQSGTIASGIIGPVHLADASVQSGEIASGIVGPVHLADGSVQSGEIGSGIIGSVHLADAAVQSGDIASGSVGFPHHANASVQSGHVASGQIFNFHVAAQGLASGNYASGSVGFSHHANASVQSGTIASGSVSTPHYASGAIIMHATEVLAINSGGFGHSPTVLTVEAISGVRAVSMDQSGQLRIAMAAVSGRMPAIGVVYDNVASGIRANVHIAGFVQFPNAGSGQSVDYSGFLGRRTFVGNSGQLVALSGSYNSGGFLSGALAQAVGIVVNSGGVLFNVVPIAFSGSPTSGVLFSLLEE